MFKISIDLKNSELLHLQSAIMVLQAEINAREVSAASVPKPAPRKTKKVADTSATAEAAPDAFNTAITSVTSAIQAGEITMSEVRELLEALGLETLTDLSRNAEKIAEFSQAFTSRIGA